MCLTTIEKCPALVYRRLRALDFESKVLILYRNLHVEVRTDDDGQLMTVRLRRCQFEPVTSEFI